MSFLVVRPGPLATVQDLGRRGLGRFGIPDGGALDQGGLRTANRLAGNPPGAVAIEYTLAGPRLRWQGRRPVEVGIAGDAPVQLTVRPGEVIDPGLLRERARGYLAVRGGFEVPLVLGGRGTSLAGGFGGFRGRALVAGDRLRAGAPVDVARAGEEVAELRADLSGEAPHQPLRVLGTGAPAAALRALTGATWRVDAGDRVGLRLAGPPLRMPRLGASRPLVPGAVQVTGEGQPIVLLRDHPTIGGYPVVGVVIGVDLDRAAQLRPATALRFRRVSEAAALAALDG